MWKKVKPYLISILIALAVGGLSAWITSADMEFYQNRITHPPLAPPPILFPIVWSVLYILMGIGSAIVWNNRSTAPRLAADALTVYGISLAVNFAWSILFFKLHVFLFAFIWLILLWLLILAVILLFRKVRPVAGYLQIPYLLWVTFAGYLNCAIWLLNK